MEDVLAYMMGVIMYGIFAAMFGYELRVVQEERALARKQKRMRFFAAAQNDRGYHQTFKGKMYKNDDYNINSAPSCSYMAPHLWKPAPLEKLGHGEGVHMRFAEIQRAYQDGECVATKEVYGCRKKEADADGR